MPNQPYVYVDKPRRDAVAQLIMAMGISDAKVEQSEEPKRYQFGHWFYLTWSAHMREGQTDARSVDVDLSRPAGEEYADAITGQRIVTLTVRAESWTWEVTATQMLEELLAYLELPGWHEDLRRIGFVNQGQLGSIQHVPAMRDERSRSIAALSLRLAYASQKVDPVHRYTWIETVVVRTTPDNTNVQPPPTWVDETDPPPPPEDDP